MEFHPIANLFPLLEGEAFDALCADIRANGLLEPIVVYEGRILDGRNRYRALEETGAEAAFVGLDGDDALQFVVSKNLHRRHLNESQRSMVAARLANMRQGERTDLPQIWGRSVSQSEAGKMLNVSSGSVDYAAKVQRDGVPELVAAVDAGKVRVSAAAAAVDAVA